MFHVEEIPFYLGFSFSAKKQSFVIFLILADTAEAAEKYSATVWLEQVYPQDLEPVKQTFLLNVVSIEDMLHDIDGDLPASHYIAIPYTEMQKFFSYTSNDDAHVWPDEEDFYTVCLPVQIEDMTKKTLK